METEMAQELQREADARSAVVAEEGSQGATAVQTTGPSLVLDEAAGQMGGDDAQRCSTPSCFTSIHGMSAVHCTRHASPCIVEDTGYFLSAPAVFIASIFAFPPFKPHRQSQGASHSGILAEVVAKEDEEDGRGVKMRHGAGAGRAT